MSVFALCKNITVRCCWTWELWIFLSVQKFLLLQLNLQLGIRVKQYLDNDCGQTWQALFTQPFANQQVKNIRFQGWGFLHCLQIVCSESVLFWHGCETFIWEAGKDIYFLECCFADVSDCQNYTSLQQQSMSTCKDTTEKPSGCNSLT